MANRTSMEDIAVKLGVSRNTVSLALRGRPGINSQTRALILDTAREMGYQYGPLKAAEGSSGTSRNICLVLSGSTRDAVWFFSHIQYGIEDEARQNQTNTILSHYDDNREFEIPLCIRDGLVSGIVTLGRISAEKITALLKCGLPLVMADHYVEELDTDCVLTDNFCGGYSAARYLMEKGHRDIGFIGDMHASPSFYDRYQGYLKALRLADLQPDPACSITGQSLEVLANRDPSLAAAAVNELPRLLPAYFCCNDMEALTLMRVLAAMGRKVPEDVSVVGFDDIEMARNSDPGLTTFRVEKEFMGRRAVQRLISGMEGKAVEKVDTAERKMDAGAEGRIALPEKQLISATLVERHSVKKV